MASGPWSLLRALDYGYDIALDDLTSVTYDVGGTNEYRTWAYDPAGNRSSDSANSGTWTYDNLNRMSASPGHTYSNDILGNRTNRDYATQSSTAMRHDWDVLNRAINILGTSTGGSYAYRADGQRVEKVEGATLLWTPTGSRGSGFYDTNYATNRPTSRYFYDGQMGFEDDYNPSGSVTKVNRYALGARGIDRIERYESSATTYGYPLYDGHGNIRTTLAKSGSSYSTGTFKTYDVWGSVRSGGDSSDPKQKYCGSLGHVSDDESGLTYMRARYYEPSTGRFVSEDSALSGANWFAYGDNEPNSKVDATGHSASIVQAWMKLQELLIDLNHFVRTGTGNPYDCMHKIRKLKVALEALYERAQVVAAEEFASGEAAGGFGTPQGRLLISESVKTMATSEAIKAAINVQLGALEILVKYIWN